MIIQILGLCALNHHLSLSLSPTTISGIRFLKNIIVTNLQCRGFFHPHLGFGDVCLSCQEHWLKLCTASLLSPVLSARLQAEARHLWNHKGGSQVPPVVLDAPFKSICGSASFKQPMHWYQMLHPLARPSAPWQSLRLPNTRWVGTDH